MSDIQVPNGSSSRDDNAKTSALIAYGLLAFGLFTGLFWVIGGIWAVVKKEDAQGTVYYGHFNEVISIFWKGLLLYIIGFMLLFFIVGYFILLAAWVWSVYKIIKGLARLTSNNP